MKVCFWRSSSSALRLVKSSIEALDSAAEGFHDISYTTDFIKFVLQLVDRQDNLSHSCNFRIGVRNDIPCLIVGILYRYFRLLRQL